MNKMKKCFGLLVTVTSLGLMSACQSNDTKQAETDEKVYRVVVKQEMPSADLSIATNTISFSALNNVYEGLYRLDEENQPQPAGAAALAEKSEDGLTYRFKLREEAKWSNGDPVTAADYVYGWQRTADPKTGAEYAYMFELLANGIAVTQGEQPVENLGIKAIGDYELEITLASVTPYFDYLLAFPSFFPQQEATVQEFGSDYAKTSENAIYNGPFVLAEFDGPGSDTKWAYVKNDEYWDAANVQVDRIDVDVVKEATTAVNLYQDNQTDDVVLSGELAKQMANDPALEIEKDARTTYLEFNQRADDSPYHNENLRKAIATAIDGETVANQILGDGSIAATGLVTEGLSISPVDQTDFSAANAGILKNDPATAKKYWEAAQKELGISSLQIELVGDDDDAKKKVMEYVQGAIEETLPGIKVNVTPVPFTVRLERGKNGEFDMLLGGWGADFSDPISFIELFKTDGPYNRGRYSNPAYDELIEASVTTDDEKRWESLVAAEKILLDDMGIVPVYQQAEAHLRRETIKGVVVHPAGARYDYKWVTVE